jgi:hypothetical protein
MKSQVLQNLIQVSYTVPNGHNLRKACYQMMKLNSRKASPLDDQLSLMSDREKRTNDLAIGTLFNFEDNVAQHGGVEVGVDALFNVLPGIVPTSMPAMYNYVLHQNVAALHDEREDRFDRYYEDSRDEGIKQQKKLIDMLISKPASFPMLAKNTDQVAKDLFAENDNLALQYLKDAKIHANLPIEKSIQKLVVDTNNGSPNAFLSFLKSYGIVGMKFLMGHLNLSRQTAQVAGPYILVALICFILFKNFGLVKKYLTIGLTKLGQGISDLLSSLASVSSQMGAYIKGLFNKVFKRAVLEQAYISGDRRAIRLASMLQ